MSNPPVRYDSEGTSGMINIVSRKVKVIGFSGTLGAGFSKGHSARGAADGSLNYKGRKGSVYSNFGYANRTFYNSYIFDRTYDLPPALTYLKEVGEQINYQELFYYKVGGDYSFSSKTTIGFQMNGGPSNTPFTDIGVNTVSGDNVLGYDYTLYNVETRESRNVPGYNINLEHHLDTSGTTLSYSGDLSLYDGTREAHSDNRFYSGANEVLAPNVYKSRHETDIDIITNKLDFNKTLKRSWLLETGVKSTVVKSSNDYTLRMMEPITGTFILNNEFSNVFRYHESISAGYVNLKKEISKTSIQAGVRSEYTFASAHNITSGWKFDKQYLSFFPNVSLDKNLGGVHKMTLTAGRRIDRPSYRDLNPFKSYQDNYSSTVGNPNLKPQTSVNSAIRHSYKEMLFTTVSYSRYSNLIISYDFQNDSTKETTSTLSNLSKSDFFSVNPYFQKNVTSYLHLTMSANLFYQDFSGDLNNTNVDYRTWSYNGNFSADIIFPAETRFVVSSFYNGPFSNGFQSIRPSWSLDVSLRKSFYKNKLSLTLSAFDLFHKNVFSMRSVFQNQDYIFITTPDSRRVFLHVLWKFGNVKVDVRQKASNEEEKGRLNGGGGK